MPWYFNWSDPIKKRACRYLLQRYLGQFLKEKLSLDQLTLNLYSGKGTIADVCLDVKGLNELGETYNLPIRFVDGYISSISVTIPWSSLLTDNSVVEVNGLMMTIQPKQRTDDASMFDSVWGSMVSSLQLAEECLKQHPLDSEKESGTAQPLEGLEQFAHAIETVFCRIKVRLLDTVIRIEHVPKYSNKIGTALEIRIKKVDYFDQAGVEDDVSAESLAQRSIYEPAALSTKKIILEGTSFYTDEFSCSDEIILSEGPKTLVEDGSGAVAGSPEMPPPHTFNRAESPPKESDIVSDPILISRLIGRQEIKLQLKQNELIAGPNVEVEFNLGQLPLFLSPRQVHLLIELAKGFYLPGVELKQNDMKFAAQSKPMEPQDFARIEQDLQKQLTLNKLPTKALGIHPGWSTHSLADSDDEYLPLTKTNALTSSRTSDQSSAASDMETSTSSGMSSDMGKPGYTWSSSKRKARHRGSGVGCVEDYVSELTHFCVRCSSIYVVILHNDIISPGSNGSVPSVCPSPYTVSQMKNLAETFFQELKALIISGYSLKNFQSMKHHISDICKTNHLRIVAAPFTLEGTEKSSSLRWLLSLAATVGSAEVLECLFDNKGTHLKKGKDSSSVEYYKILGSYVDPNDKSESTDITEPFLRVKCEHEERSHLQGYRQPSTSVNIQFNPIHIEIDASLVDRIYSLLHPQVFSSSATQQHGVWQSPSNDDNSLTSHKTSIKVFSPFARVDFRFPIPDLRPQHNMERVPWWHRNLHSDVITLDLTEAHLSTKFEDSESNLEVELVCRDVHALYQESVRSAPISFLRVFLDPTYKEDGFDWPRLLMRISPDNRPSPLETEVFSEKEDIMPSILHETMLLEVDNDTSTPFTTRRVVYQSDNNHSATEDHQSRDHQNEVDEVIMPADKSQVKSFMDKASNNSRFFFDFTLPSVNLYLPDKHFYEVLYNRLTMDLVLWEPAVPQPTWNPEGAQPRIHFPSLDVASQIIQNSSYFQAFSMCRSAFKYDSDEESEDGAGVYYSVYENKQRHHHRQQRDQMNLHSTQSYIAFAVHVNEGLATLRTPLRDIHGNVVPEQHGEMQLHVNDGQLFTVIKYQGEADVGYVCINANTAKLYHKGQVCTPTEHKVLEPTSLLPSSNLYPVLYKSGPGVNVKQTFCQMSEHDAEDMVSMVMKISLEPKQNLKTIKIAVGFNNTTLNHRITAVQRNWIKQFIDFFDVLDYPVLGYTPAGVVTELHLNLGNCAIDYRPLHIPYQTLVTLENLSISSNIAAKTTTSLLRIIAEEVCVFISDKVTTAPPDLQNDYVCVIDTGLFDISLRLTDGEDPLHPCVDLRASNNIVHVRTCADSCRALQTLITYLASDGDLIDDLSLPLSAESSRADPETLSSLSKSQADQFHDLMAEAMRESSSGSRSTESESPSFSRLGSMENNGDEMKLSFEDKNNSPPLEFSPEIDNQDGEEAEALNGNIYNEDPFMDGEFCILENDPGTGIASQSGEPEVRLLVSEPVRLVENHFSVPIRKTDQLKAPKNFPRAIQKYTLREMSLVWHMYGGCDFSSTKPKDLIKDFFSKEDEDDELDSPNIILNQYGGVTFAKTSHAGYSSPPTPATPTHHIEAKGGPGRRNDVLMELQMNKIRFQHELYPEDKEQASRQVLLIHDVEIRDRLASSQINKFLYQYTSESMPRQSHANMVVLKIVHIRPDVNSPVQECSLRVSLRPLRLNIDQDALLFLYNFFVEVSTVPDIPDCDDGELPVKQTRQFSVPSSSPSAGAQYQPCGLTPTEPDQRLVMIQDAASETKDLVSPTGSSCSSAKAPVFIRSFVFSPEVPIRLDYHGKRVAMEQGALAGLLMGLGQFNCLELKLKKLNYRHGLLGVDKLVAYAVNEWLCDIKKNQLPNVLGGVGPMHSFIQLFNGIRDLFWLPIEQYRKDGRIVRGIQRGTNSFTTSTAMACLELTNRLVQTIQGAAEFAYDMVSPGPSLKVQVYNRHRKCFPNTQPVDIREGMANAYQVVTEGLEDTARTIVHAASTEHRQKGVSGAVGGVLRHFPSTVVKPIILATEAASNVLGGVRNQLVPDARREAVEKWRQDTNTLQTVSR